MSGYVVLTTTCGVCGKMFHCNPNRVPSKDNQAFCQECVEEANLERVKLGMDAHPIHPEAYKPLPEQELR
tara:strand:+ start:352 stop:561 length:210 start_codon:yes stop_codon:yes gene_type:complete